MKVSLTVNGARHDVETPDNTLLVDLIRTQLRLTGKGARNSVTLSAGRTTNPSGMPKSLASVARRLLGATSTNAIKPIATFPASAWG